MSMRYHSMQGLFGIAVCIVSLLFAGAAEAGGPVGDAPPGQGGWIGVSIQAITPETAQALGLHGTNGALVVDVAPGGPAERAGIARGDVIVSFDGTEIMTASDLPPIVGRTSVDRSVEVNVMRDGRKMVSYLHIAAAPTGASSSSGGGRDMQAMGVRVTNLLFFESGDALPAMGERRYAVHFRRKDARRINWELDLEYPRRDQRIDFQLIAVYYRPDGSKFCEMPFDAYLDAGWTSSNHFGGWGWPAPGNWQPGTYRCEVYAYGKMIASGSFTVDAAGATGEDVVPPAKEKNRGRDTDIKPEDWKIF